MNRRDFLFFRKARGQRVAELSCERLFMRLVDARIVPASEDADSSMGEPPRVVDETTAERLFADLERELHEVDAVRLVDPSWLTSSDVRARLDAVLNDFQAAGGRVDGR